MEYLKQNENINDDLKAKMLKAWEWEEGVSLDLFIRFMCTHYRYSYDGLEYDPDFGKLIKKLDEEQAKTNLKQRAAFYKKRQKEM